MGKTFQGLPGLCTVGNGSQEGAESEFHPSREIKLRVVLCTNTKNLLFSASFFWFYAFFTEARNRVTSKDEVTRAEVNESLEAIHFGPPPRM